MFLNWNVQFQFDLLKPDAKDRVMEKQAKQAKHHDCHSTSREVSLGQNVMTRNFCQKTNGYPELLLSV